MKLTMSFKHMRGNISIKEYAEEKSTKLKKYFKGKISVTWNFTHEEGAKGATKIAHCHLVGNRMNYFGEASAEDFEKSIDNAVTKIEKQLRKHKEIVKDHLHNKNAE